MKRYISFIKGLLLIAFIVFLYGFSSHRNKAKKIENIDIKFENGDNLFITYEMVNKLLIQNYKGLKNQSKENIFLKGLEETLLSNKMIENAEVFLSVNGELGAIIKQKTPIARVNQSGRVYYIDSKGNKMPLSSNYSARVPIIEGIYDGKISKEMYQLAKLIYEDDFLKKQIVGMTETPKKEFLLKTRVGNQTIELGNLQQIDKKIKKLKVFYHKVLKDETLGTYKKINLMYSNQVVCTKN
jgi:cell division protein FtsQ